MSIIECEGIEEIIMCVRDEEKDQLAFSKLEFLELRCLPSLAGFCLGNHSFKFPSLKQIIVRQCPNLKVFCWGILSTPKLRKLQLTEKEDEEGCWEGDLNTTLRHLFQGMVGFRGLEKLELSKFPHLKEIWDGQISVCFFSNLRSLVVEKCMNITSAISVKLLPFLNNLTFLRVEDCDSVEEIFHLDKLNHDGHTGLLSQLTSLDLVELPRLRNILNISHLEIHAFVSLKMLSIHKCSNLRYIVTTTIIQGLVQLQEVRIRDCVMVEEIIAEDRPKDAAKDCITVPQLNSIFLELLPNLTSFCSEINVLQCPCLETVTIKDCPKMETFLFASMEDHDPHKTSPFVKRLPTMSSFIQNLTILIVDGCDSLECMLSSSMVESLVKLKNFEIRNCMVMEGIIVIEEENERMILFPQLELLVLKNLPRLTRFCDFTGNLIELNSLSTLWLENCPNVEKFISNSACGDTMLINDDHMQPFFDKKVQLPSLQFLKMAGLDKLRKIWHDQLKLDIFSQLRKLTIEYCQNVKAVFSSDWRARLEKLDSFTVSNCQSLEEIFYVPKINTVATEELSSVVPRIVFPQLTVFCLHDLPKLRSFYSGKHISEWPVLKELDVRGCDNVEILASEFRSVQQILDEENQNDNPIQQPLLFLDKVAFPSLKNLKLSSLNIKSIWLDQIPTVTLTSLVVERCNSLKYLFPFSMVRRLAQLQRLQICNCELIEMIIDTEELVGKNKRIETRFPELCHLKLEGLPKLTSFGSGSLIEFPSLDDLQINNCSSLNTFCSSSTYVDAQPLLDEKVLLSNMASLSISSINCDNIWLKQLPVASSCNRYLTTISVDGCANLKYLFSSSMAKSLDQLKNLYIHNCTIMEEIIVTAKEEKTTKMLFPSLIRMELENLPKLARFCSFTGISIELPLTELWIKRCPSMQTFISNSTCVEVEVSMELEEANSEENISPLFDDKVGLPNLKHLIIREMDNLRRIWHNRQALHRSSNLHGLAIGYCKRLVNVFPYQMVGRLGKLELLYVYDCDSLEYIIEKHETMTEENIFCEEEVIKEIPPKFVFPRLAEVQLRELPMLKNFYPGVHILGWRVLTLLDVFGCCNKGKTYCAEYLSLQESNGKSYKEIPNDQLPLFLVDSKAAFQRLEEWAVELNDSMPQICDGIYGIQLSKLKVLRITCSPNAATLPTCVIPVLPNLDKLFIEGAHFKEIFLFEEQQGCQGESARTPIRLSELTLAALPSLLHLCRENSRPSQVFQGLTTLRVLKCSSLKVLIPPLVCFQNLTTLEVSNCHGLINLGTLPTAKSLTQLTRMSITECEGIEEIIMCVGDEEKEEIFFSKLEFLELRGLLSLASFCSGNHSFKFPSLKQIIVRQCPNLKVFCWGILSTPKLRKLQLTEKEDEEGCWEGDLNTTLRHLFQGMVGFRDLEFLTLSKCPHLKEIWNDQIPVSFFSKLRSLMVDDCPDISCAVPINLLPCLNSLRVFCVKDCEMLEELFHLDELNDADGHSELLPQLNNFRLIELPRLRDIWGINHLDILGFVNLKILYIRKCSSLRYILTTTIILGLKQLQEVTIRDCVMVEEIITEDRLKDATANNIIVPLLNSVLLESLPNLKSFYSGSSVLECPSLKTISMTDCPEVKTFVSSSTKGVDFYYRPLFGNEVAFPILEELKLSKLPNLAQLWNESNETFQNLVTLEITDCGSLKSLWPYSVSLQKLTTLEISKCDGLTSVVTFSTAKSLEQLTKININDCKMMEEIVMCVGGEDNDQVVFRELKYLGLCCLPSITGFYLGNYTIELPSLEQVVVRQCSKMNTFSQGAVSTPKLLSVQFTESVDVSRWESDLNTIIQKLSQESLRIN